jgi:two-component system, sensor histidine kinase and response regulator
VVEVETTDHDDRFALCIRDRGRGMTPEQIKSVGTYMQFERKLYEQQGLGLGLVIAKSLVELHDGRLAIESTPYEGTRVCVELNAARL